MRWYADVQHVELVAAKSLGATDLVNPKDLDGPLNEKLREMTDGGLDYAIVSVGNIDAMSEAVRSCHPSWGQTVIVGLTPAGSKLELEAMDIVNGRKVCGSFMGGTATLDHYCL
ncbi:adhC [Cordylochernes scorpioides]|uniref:AdhC n=1 Tax=Cordylochernes scorpioides TaxID=51811 RepID=A0ABY6K2L0_9ARAC|nr:adhC [Cordylochernes scorpioides]